MSLKQLIIEKIKAKGPITFETFMEMALYYPGLGYYVKDSAKIGRAGDFYTSSHLHPIFGAVLGRQMKEMWELLGSADPFEIVEMGAGMGYLAKDMLEYLKQSAIRSQKSEGATGGLSLFTDEAKRSRRIGTVPDHEKGNFFECVKYTIVELNPAMKAKQQALLEGFEDKVLWVSNLDELESIRGCLLSNELLDALPVRLVEMDEELMEIYVDVGDDGLAEIKMPCSDEIKDYFKAYSIVIARGYRTEVNLMLKVWLRDVSRMLKEGFVLTVDYGYPAYEYYSEERSRGTLLCYYQHQTNENPFQNIGEQDLTAHVNFSSLKKWGEEFGLKTVGYSSQGTYLISLGIDEVMKELYGDSPDPFEVAKIKGLILPQGMGESHKVMIQYKGEGAPKLRGFAVRNQKGRL